MIFIPMIMEWDKDSIKLMVDDKLGEVQLTLIPPIMPMGRGIRCRCARSISLLNSAVGGAWCEKAPKDGQGYPVKFLVDYVRFYQTKEHAQQAKQFDPETGLPKRSPFSRLRHVRRGGRTCNMSLALSFHKWRGFSYWILLQCFGTGGREGHKSAFPEEIAV